MKIGDLVMCIDSTKWEYEGPVKGEIREIEGIVNIYGTKFINIEGYYELTINKNRVDFNSRYFRVIEFPPFIEEEIKECLTRELVEV